MDAAEAWLAEHDPHYLRSRQAWKDLDENGEYQSPPQEIPVGDASDVALLVAGGSARHFEHESRVCERCSASFVPSVSFQRFCSDGCQDAARGPRDRDRTDYMRDYMREYRRRKAA